MSDGDIDTRVANDVKMMLDSFRSAPVTPVFSEDESVFNSPNYDSKMEETDGCLMQKNDSPLFLAKTATTTSSDSSATEARDDLNNDPEDASVEKRKISVASDSTTLSKRIKTEQFSSGNAALNQCSVDKISSVRQNSAEMQFAKSLSRDYERISASRSNSTSNNIALIRSNNSTSSETKN